MVLEVEKRSRKFLLVGFTLMVVVVSIMPQITDGSLGLNSLEVEQLLRINDDSQGMEVSKETGNGWKNTSNRNHNNNNKEQVGIRGGGGGRSRVIDRIGTSYRGKCQVVRLVRVKATTINDGVGSGGDGGKGTAVKCNGLTNLTIALGQIPPKVISSIRSIEIEDSSIPLLNLSIFQGFPALENLSVIYSNVSFVVGPTPGSILNLNLSSNLLKSIDISVFYHSLSKREHKEGNQHEGIQPLRNNSSNSSWEGETNNSHQYPEQESLLKKLQIIDLSHNKIAELPKSIFYLGSLKSLRLAGNQFKCEFVWEKLWEWYVASNPDIFPDADETFCGVMDDVNVFHYTVLGVLKARQDLEKTCGSVDKTICPDCSLYALQREGNPISHKSSHGSVSISLKLDCSNRNLSFLPPVPPQTWQLNISNNFIKDLSPLKESIYSNLLILDADNNEVNLDTLAGTPFLDKFNYLNLQNNRFSTIPAHILSSLKGTRGQGVTFFGGNFIDCDCDVVKEVKPLLIENSKKIKDMKDIYCKEITTNGDDNSYLRVKDLQFPDVCYMETSESSNELYLYLVILIEVLLIIAIIGKVWHDQRTFRRTGILPWCSAKMPRLPCDAILESVKEPPNFNNRHTGSANSSLSTQVNNAHSATVISHIQLKDISSSGHSDKSSRTSQQSQFSSFPCSSSRTSPV